MAMTAKTKQSRIDNLEKRIALIVDRKKKATASIRALNADQEALEHELDWVKKAPVIGQIELPVPPDDELPVEVERTVVPAASPTEVASTPVFDHGTGQITGQRPV